MKSNIIDLLRVVAHKVYDIYPSHIHYRTLVPVGEMIKVRLKVPERYAYIVIGEIHDVPSEYFIHECWKDGKLVLPPTLIDNTSMQLTYAEPFLVEKEWIGIVRNVSHIYHPPGNDEIFRLRVIILVVEKWIISRIRDYVRLFREMEPQLYQFIASLSIEDRIKLFLEKPEIAITMAR